MATYEYHCATCGKDFEATQSMKDDAFTLCPASVCPGTHPGEGVVQRRISGGGGVIYKGDGFYLTDYVRKGGDAKGTNAAPAAAPAASPNAPASTPSAPASTPSAPAATPAAPVASSTPSSSTTS